jgi:hypothetical protein
MPRTHLTLKKPRTEGRKYISEKLVGLDKGTLEVLDPLVDVVKIYSVLPLLISEDSKTKFSYNNYTKVSTGTTNSKCNVAENAFN